MILAVLNAICAIAWLTVKKIQDFNGIWTRDLVIPTELWSYWSWELVNYVFICSRERDESVIDEYKSYKNCKDHSSFDFISAVLKWFIHTVYTSITNSIVFWWNKRQKKICLEDFSLSVINKYYSTKAQLKRKRFCDSGVGFIHKVCCQFR